MNTDELRKWASEASRRDGDKDISDALFIAADAWEADRKRLEAAEKQIEGMTAGGSEFAGDTQRCLADIRERLAVAGKVAADRNALRKRLAELEGEAQSSLMLCDLCHEENCGGPSVCYCPCHWAGEKKP